MADLPADCQKYITEDLGLSLGDVLAHRRAVNRGTGELYYCVLMRGMFTVIFTGRYQSRSLGPYEEAYTDGAALVGWECLSDADPWEHSVGKFKTATAEFICNGGE